MSSGCNDRNAKNQPMIEEDLKNNARNLVKIFKEQSSGNFEAAFR